MSFLKKETKNIQIGLDVGSHSIKAACVLHSASKPQLAGFSVKPIGANIVKAIRDAYLELGFAKNRVVTSVAGSSVIIRYVTMLSMTDDELMSASRFEAEKVIPFNINDVELDSVKIEDLADNKMRAIIVAARKDLVSTHVKLLDEAGLEPAALDVDSFAISNAFVQSGLERESVCALVNIGNKRSNLVILKAGTPYLSRDIDIGAAEAVKLVAESSVMQPVDAQKYFDEHVDKIAEAGPEDKAQMERALTNVISRLCDEIRFSLDFYENDYARSVDKVYISGGLARSEVVTELVKESLGQNVSTWNCLSGLTLSEKIDQLAVIRAQPQLAVAIGLALRKTD